MDIDRHPESGTRSDSDSPDLSRSQAPLDVDTARALADYLRPILSRRRITRWVASVMEVDDIIQESLLRLHRSALGGSVAARSLESLQGLIVVISERVIYDALRHARRRGWDRRSPMSDILASPARSEPRGNAPDQLADLRRGALAWLLEMTTRRRLVVAAAMTGEMTDSELAFRLHRSTSAVRGLRARLLHRLRAILRG